MTVCLVCPSEDRTGVFQPLGLAYIAAVLEREFDLEVVDYQVRADDPDYSRYDAVGISIPYTASAASAYRIARRIRERNPGAFIFMGGPHASVCAEECLNYADAVVLREGEMVVADVVRQRRRGIIEGPRIENLDDLPFPARHRLPMAQYFAAAACGCGYRCLREPWATIITSRGCPHACLFCSIHLTMGRKWRARSAENVLDELSLIFRQFPVQKIGFEDDNLSHDPQRLTAICEGILRRQLRFKWFTPNGVRADTLNRELLHLMARAGCEELSFAPESGVQRVVDNVICKKLDLSVIPDLIRHCNEFGIRVSCFFVIGNLGETLDEMRQTVAYAQMIRRLGGNYLINIATPLPGTRLYEIAKAKGYLRPHDPLNMWYNRQLYMDTPEFRAEDVARIWQEAEILRFTPLELGSSVIVSDWSGGYWQV